VSRDKETSRKRKARVNAAIAESVDSNEELTEVEKEFCLHYVQCHNISQAAWRAGHYKTYNSAKVNGWKSCNERLMRA
jgi:hypothetical protein